MRGICFAEIGKVEILDLADPQVEQSGDCIVRVELAGLCGSDLHPYWGRETGLDRGTVMGHEFVGTIVETGSQVRKFKVGERVFAPFSTNCGECFYCQAALPSRCQYGQLFGWRSNGQGLQGAQAEFVRVPLADGTLMRVPERVGDELALLLGDNLSTGYFCTELAEVNPHGVYVVIGCGNVGLMALTAARIKGCHQIIAMDPVVERRLLAEQLGAIAVVAPDASAVELVQSFTQGRGADGVMELVGNPAAQRLAYQLVRPGGIIATVGCHCAANFSFSPVEAYDKNLCYRTGRCPARHYMNYLTHLPAIRELQVKPLITHTFSLSDGPRAYEVFSQRLEGIIKGVFDMR
jgi:alcohol dehydrogenase